MPSKRNTGRGGADGKGAPPPDMPPSGNEFRQGEILKVTLRPGKFPGETVGEPTQGKRTPPFIVIEKIPPGFFPGGEIDVKVVFASRNRAAAEVVGPEDVVNEIQRQLTEGLAKSEKYWKENLLVRPLHIKSDRIQKRERRDGPPRFEYEFQDTRDGQFPLKVFIPNLPADWDPKAATTTELLVKSIEIHNRDKRLVGEAWATAFPEPKIPPEQEARSKVRELLAEIKDPKGSHTLEMDLAEAKVIIVKKDGRWIIPDIGEALYHAEVRLDVPRNWSPDQLTADPVVYQMTDARAEGSKILVRCRIEGVEPAPEQEQAPVEEQKGGKVEVKAAKGFGKKLGEALQSMTPAEVKPALDPLLAELDTPELADLKGLKRRLEVIDLILEQIALIRTHLITQGTTDDEALLKLPKLLEQKKKVDAERKRVDKAIMDAQEVWGETIREIKRELDVPRAARLERLERLRPMVEQAAEVRVFNRVNGHPDTGPGILEIEDLEELKRLQAENEVVLKQKEEFVYDGVWPEKPGDPDYRLSEMAEDFLVAEMLVPHFADRIAELERMASGAPAPVPPPATPPDLGLPGPLNVPPSTPDTGRPTPVEPVEEISTDDMMRWLRREGFGTGVFVGFTSTSRRRLTRIFGVTSLPEHLRVRNLSIPDEEVEFDLPDGTTGVLSIEQLYRMEQEMAGLANVLEAAGLMTNVSIEMDNDAVVALLRPRMEQWITENPGKPLPNKARIERVDLVSGELSLDLSATPGAGVVRVPLEDMAGVATAKKIKVLTDVTPLVAAGRDPRLETIRPAPVVERLLSAEVAAGQVWRYDGRPSQHLNPGGNFRVDSVDDAAGVVRIITAKEEAAADRARRPAQKFLVTKEQWRGLPKTFVSGPQPESAGPRSAVTPQAEEERLLREIEVGQVYVYEGPDAYPFKPNDQFNIVALDRGENPSGEKFVSFVIEREAEAARVQRKKPQVYKLRLSQWKLIKKRLLRGGPVTPPSTPPVPPAPPRILPPSIGPRLAPPTERATPPPAIPDRDWSLDATGSNPIPETRTDPWGIMEPTGPEAVRPPAAERAVPPPRPTPPPPQPHRPELTYPDARPGEIETPSSFQGLVDLMRSRDLIRLAKAEAKKRAGILGGLLSVISDPFAAMGRKIETIATQSGAALTVNDTLKERLVDAPQTQKVEEALRELREAEQSYRRTEATALQYTVDQFNALLSGRKVDTDDDRVRTLDTVQKAITRLQKANEKARAVLESPSAPSGSSPRRR